jgi:tetratricopeptide (TPR) repeat protein
MKRSFIETRAAGLFLIFLFFVSVSGQHQIAKETADEIKLLAPGETVEREIAPQQRHRYQIKLDKGQFVKIGIAEKGCDTVMSLRSPDGINLLEFAEIKPVSGVKYIQAAVAETGNYELRVISYGAIDGAGTYSVKIGEIRPATEQELNFTAGVKIFNETFNAVNPALLTAESLRASVTRGNLAVEKFRLAKAVKQEAFALRQIANISIRLGINPQIIEFYQSVLEKYRSISDRRGEANTLQDFGNVLADKGEWERAIQILSESLKIAREIKLEMVEAGVLNKLGEIYAHFGDFDRAAIYYAQSADIYLQYNNMSRSIPLNNLGKIARDKGEAEKAADYFRQAIEIVRSEKYRFGTSKYDEATYLNNLGRTEFALGRFDEAARTFQESLKISGELSNKPGQAAALKFLGQIYLQTGDAEKSETYFTQSLEIYRTVENRQNMAQMLLLLAKTEAKKGNLSAAQTKTEEAINLIETIRSRVQTAELRDSFSANLQDFYAFYVEILMRKHHAEPDKNYAALAFQANERGRARGLLNLLAESNSDIRQGVDEKLLSRETDLKNLLSARLENLTRVLGGKAKPEDTEKLKNEIEQIRAEYEQIQTAVRAASPRYSSLTQPKTLDLSEIQNRILDADSVLLEYALGDEKSYLWIISKNDFRFAQLPAKSEIEAAARKFYDALTARNRQIKFETAAEFGDRVFIADSDARKYSDELSRMILAPAAPFIQNKRLLIIADGALQYVQSPKSKVLKPKTKNQKPKTFF